MHRMHGIAAACHTCRIKIAPPICTYILGNDEFGKASCCMVNAGGGVRVRCCSTAGPLQLPRWCFRQLEWAFRPRFSALVGAQTQGRETCAITEARHRDSTDVGGAIWPGVFPRREWRRPWVIVIRSRGQRSRLRNSVEWIGGGRRQPAKAVPVDLAAADITSACFGAAARRQAPDVAVARHPRLVSPRR